MSGPILVLQDTAADQFFVIRVNTFCTLLPFMNILICTVAQKIYKRCWCHAYGGSIEFSDRG